MAAERRATGIYAKHGKLYVVISDSEITNGNRKKKHRWVCTELADKSRNIRQAKEFRENLLVQRDGGFKANAKVTMGQFVTHYLEIKKELLQTPPIVGWNTEQNIYNNISIMCRLIRSQQRM